ncbi:hypothetical protein SP076_00200 [Salmonella phage FSL SP-076]|uniref:Uncharacterized protein n=1 Tax=Salmonella phage FSL SP-076 TaxID=1173762 RepID=S4TP29_9CAUD|nr:hypothetical protein SP076_00200 [Salmonella phage FSL SP-076]AGF88371.1 hypothetical protein SP076_00200 [Salmonella phage FSL SP-076]
MQIVLQHDEILEALKEYANRIINVAPGNDITIDLKAGRGENGYSATLEITPQRLTSTHDPKGPNVRASSSEGSVGLRTEVVERTVVEPSKGILREVAPELPVEGETVVDTAPTEPVDPAAHLSEEQVDAEVDEFLANQNPTKSLFARN